MSNATMNSTKSFLPSIVALILANLVPVFGVLYLGWEVYPLMLLFWIENVLIGIFNVLKMLACNPGNTGLWLVKIFIVPFFTVHYGMFTFIHGLFVVSIFGGAMRMNDFPNSQFFWNIIWEQHLIWGVVGLAVSHAISFATNFIGRGEYKLTDPKTLMAQPYGRVMVLHVTILIGGALMMALKSPTAGLLLVVGLKIALDVRGHLREHKKYQAKGEQVKTIM